MFKIFLFLYVKHLWFIFFVIGNFSSAIMIGLAYYFIPDIQRIFPSFALRSRVKGKRRSRFKTWGSFIKNYVNIYFISLFFGETFYFFYVFLYWMSH